MEQLTLFSQSWKYIIDTSAILSQKPNEAHRRNVYKGQWDRIDEYIRNGIIVTCSEIAEEVHEKSLQEWLLTQQCVILNIDEEVQKNVRKIVTEHPKMIEFTGGKGGSSSGDAFLIATAMKYNLAVITEENPDKPTRIPQICKCYRIATFNITELCEQEGWEF